MKKIVLLTATLIMTASMAYAGSSLISGTKHNLSVGSGNLVKSGASDQICIFCHTPHNAVRNIPLWNRNNPANLALFKFYTSSATLTAAAKGASFDANSISLFCLSCHDGNTAIGGSVVRNQSGQVLAIANSTNSTSDMLNATSTANLGTDLTNDHPVGFSYVTAQTQDSAGLKVLPANSNIQLFNTATKTSQLECASCHKVHDNTVQPFLRTTMSGSALCLACHIK